MSTPLRERPDAPLGTLIFRAGLLPAETIESALEEGVKTGKRLGEVLTERGLIKEVDLVRLLAGQKGFEYVTLREHVVDPAAAALFAPDQARLFRALPFALEAGVPVVAISDPTDDVLLRNIREALGREDVKFVVAARGELDELSTDVYSKALAVPEPEPLLEPEPEAHAEAAPGEHEELEPAPWLAPAPEPEPQSEPEALAEAAPEEHEEPLPEQAPWLAVPALEPQPEFEPEAHAEAAPEEHEEPEPEQAPRLAVPAPEPQPESEPEAHAEAAPEEHEEPMPEQAPWLAVPAPEPFLAAARPEAPALNGHSEHPPQLLAPGAPAPAPAVEPASLGAREPAPAPEPLLAAPKPSPEPEHAFQVPAFALAPERAPAPEPPAAFEPRPAVQELEPEHVATPDSPTPAPVDELTVVQDPPAPAPEPSAAPEPSSAPEPPPLPMPEPVPPPPAPYPPAAFEPVAELATDPDQAPDVAPGPVPAAEPAPQASPETETAWSVTLRLANGERVEAGILADELSAKQLARSLMAQVDGETDEWPYVNGRFLKPDTIVSVDIAELEPGDAG